jgi:hypothetical protein
LFYYDDVLVDGKRVRKYVSKKLAEVSDVYPSKRSVLLLAEKILAPLNSGTLVAESSMTVQDFIDNVYLPHVKNELRPSTYKDYRDIVRVHLRSRLGDTRLHPLAGLSHRPWAAAPAGYHKRRAHFPAPHQVVPVWCVQTRQARGLSRR